MKVQIERCYFLINSCFVSGWCFALLPASVTCSWFVVFLSAWASNQISIRSCCVFRVVRSFISCLVCVLTHWFLHACSCTVLSVDQVNGIWHFVNASRGFVVQFNRCDDKNWYKATGFPLDTLRGAMAAVGKRQSMINSTSAGAGGTSAVPRSTSQPGNCRGGVVSSSHVRLYRLLGFISVLCESIRCFINFLLFF